MYERILYKICSAPTFLFPRKCRISSSSFAVMCFISLFSIYMYTNYYSLNHAVGKTLPLDIFNETGFADTPIIVNTENINVMIRKQQVDNAYEKPVLVNETVGALHSIGVGEIIPHCGLSQPCGKNEFAVHIYSGNDNRDEPKLCIDGKYIISKQAKIGGRGLNVAVVDNMTRTIMRVVNFDTYEKDSTALETLLLTLRPGDIVIILTFDEPSRKLSRVSRLLLFDMGSALIQNLGYRGSWYMITQKGLSGFSPFEDLHLVENNGWPNKHDTRFCVPFEIHGQVIHPDPLPSHNPARVEFCEKYEDLPLFCDADVVNDPLIPSPPWKQTIAINKIYNIPIIVMSGYDAKFLPLTLETLVRQPGIKPNLVVVYYFSKHTMVPSLSELFGFMSEELTQTTNYCDQIAEAFEMNNLLFQNNKEVLFIGENAILAPDFLFFFGQMLSVMHADKTVQSISAVNDNGFKSVSGDPTLAYRVESFSALSMLVRGDFFKKSWCHKMLLGDPLFLPAVIKGVSLVPDVSRATLAAPFSNKQTDFDVCETFLSHERTITYEQNIILNHAEKLNEEDYDKDLRNALASSVPLVFDISTRKMCLKKTSSFQEKLLDKLSHYTHNGSSLSNRMVSIYYHQETENDVRSLQVISRCIGLFYHTHYPVRGLYKGVLRFMLNDNQAALVGTQSPFFNAPLKKAAILKFNESTGTLDNIPP